MTAVITVASMDEYDLNRPEMRGALSGLMRCAVQMNAKVSPVRPLSCLPSEVFSRIIIPRLSNPLKEFPFLPATGFNTADRLESSARDLLEMAAYRFALFLQITDQSTYGKIENLDISYEDDLLAFWRTFVPPTIVNRNGVEEASLNYLLRHTQLLPRRLIYMLNAVAARSHRDVKSWTEFPARHLTDAIYASEEVLGLEVLSAYQAVYPNAQAVCDAVLRDADQIINRDELERRWRDKAEFLVTKFRVTDLSEFLEMAAEIGVLGRPAYGDARK